MLSVSCFLFAVRCVLCVVCGVLVVVKCSLCMFVLLSGVYCLSFDVCGLS